MGGVPGVGKTTVARQFFAMSGFTEGAICREGLLRFHTSNAINAFTLGIYGEGLEYAGTDRLSMAVQPDAERFIELWGSSKQTFGLFFEGDRLFNLRFLQLCKKNSIAMRTMILTAPFETLVWRHGFRQDHQKASFLKGPETKMRKIQRRFECETRENVREFDPAAIAFEIKQWLKGDKDK